MTIVPGHVWVTGRRHVFRVAAAEQLSRPDVVVRTIATQEGPYAGMAALLRRVVPETLAHDPGLAAQHHVCLLHAVPELAEVIGPGPETLVSSTPHEERTRYFGPSLIRGISQGAITFLMSYARARRRRTGSPLTVMIDDVQAAEETGREFVALLLRRADPAVLRVVVGTASTDEAAR